MPIPSRVLLEQSHAASPWFSLFGFFVALNEHRPLTGTGASLSISYPASTSWRFRSSYVSGLVVMRTVICIVRPFFVRVARLGSEQSLKDYWGAERTAGEGVPLYFLLR